MPMKAVLLVLKSYLDRRAVVAFIAGSAFFLALSGIFNHLKEPITAWFLLLCAAATMAAATGLHLRQSLITCEVDLLRHYRKCHLIAAAVIWLIFIICPVILTALKGGPALTTLAAFLIFECLLTWTLFFCFSGMGIPTVIGITAIAWALSDLFKLTAKGNISHLARWTGIIGPNWALYTVVASAVGFLIFAIYYLRASCARLADESANDYWQCYATQDHVDRQSMKTAGYVASRLSRKKPLNESPFSYRYIRLIQIGLFSPGSLVTSSNGFFAAIFLGASLAFWAHLFEGMIRFMLPYGYFVISGMIAGDFLSHRNRLPVVYLQSRLSRKLFLRATVKSLILILIRGLLGFTLTMTVINRLFPLAAWTIFFQLCLAGIAVGILVTSLALLTIDRVKSNGGKGLILFFNIIALLLISPLFYHWLFIAAVAIIGVYLFMPAIRRWEQIEFEPS
jgi:hypothetical protein